MKTNNWFKCLDLNSLDRALEELSSIGSVAIPCLDKDEREALVSIVDALPRRSAKRIAGPKKTPVYQDFDLCYDVSPENPTWVMAKQLDRQIARLGKELHDVIVPRFAVLGRDDHLHAVACADDGRFAIGKLVSKQHQRGRNPLTAECELLAHLERRCTVIQSYDLQSHGLLLRCWRAKVR